MINTVGPLKNIAQQLGAMLPTVPSTQRVNENGRTLAMVKNLKVSVDTSESLMVETALVYVMAAIAVDGLKEEKAVEEKRAAEDLRDRVARRYFGAESQFSELTPVTRVLLDHIIELEKKK